MKCLGWNEIQKRAIKFVHDWKDAEDERAESQSFLNEFFDIFGVRVMFIMSYSAFLMFF